jgi:hypothetical protein
MRNSLLAVSASVFAVLASTSCTVHQQSAPGLSGPSGLAFSVRMSATPDRVLQDGKQTSTISVSVTDPTGATVAKDVQLAIVSGPGTLSAAVVHTPANVTYTPPAAAPPATPTVVTISGTIVDITGASATPGPLPNPTIDITIYPPGTGGLVTPETPTAVLTVTPSTPVAGQNALFNGSQSCPSFAVAGGCASATSTITNWDWDFGDGTAHGAGSIVTHMYVVAKAYAVTLTVTNSQGRSASITSVITVGAGTGPTALFTALPNPATVNSTITLDGTASTGSPTNFLWTITSPALVITQTGGPSPTTSFTATAAGTWNITLQVTDATGRSNTSVVKSVIVQ